jgi:hypothetical protein
MFNLDIFTFVALFQLMERARHPDEEETKILLQFNVLDHYFITFQAR